MIRVSGELLQVRFRGCARTLRHRGIASERKLYKTSLREEYHICGFDVSSLGALFGASYREMRSSVGNVELNGATGDKKSSLWQECKRAKVRDTRKLWKTIARGVAHGHFMITALYCSSLKTTSLAKLDMEMDHETDVPSTWMPEPGARMRTFFERKARRQHWQRSRTSCLPSDISYDWDRKQ